MDKSEFDNLSRERIYFLLGRSLRSDAIRILVYLYVTAETDEEKEFLSTLAEMYNE